MVTQLVTLQYCGIYSFILNCFINLNALLSLNIWIFELENLDLVKQTHFLIEIYNQCFKKLILYLLSFITSKKFLTLKN